MYGMFCDFPLDYVGLIFDEMVSSVKAKVKEQLGTKKKGGQNPENVSYPRFFSLLMGDDLIGNSKKRKTSSQGWQTFQDQQNEVP